MFIFLLCIGDPDKSQIGKIEIFEIITQANWEQR